MINAQNGSDRMYDWPLGRTELSLSIGRITCAETFWIGTSSLRLIGGRVRNRVPSSLCEVVLRVSRPAATDLHGLGQASPKRLRPKAVARQSALWFDVGYRLAFWIVTGRQVAMTRTGTSCGSRCERHLVSRYSLGGIQNFQPAGAAGQAGSGLQPGVGAKPGGGGGHPGGGLKTKAG